MNQGQVEDDRPQITFSSIPGAAIQAVFRSAKWIWRQVQADHTTLRQSRLRADTGNTEGFKVYVACAPARRISPTSLVSRREDVEAIARTILGSCLPSGPDVGRAEYARYRVDRASGGNVHILHIHNDGLIEFVWEVLSSDQAGSEPVLDLTEIGPPLERVALATQEPAYSQLFGRRRFRDRLDWYFSINAYLATDHGPVYWRSLSLDGQSLDAWGTSPPFADVDGYGGKELFNRRRKADPRSLVLTALADFADSNGVHVTRAELARAYGTTLLGQASAQPVTSTIG